MNTDIQQALVEYAAKYPPLIVVEQAAEIAQVPLSTIYDWSSRGLLQKVKKGRRIRLNRDSFIRWLLEPNQ